MAVTQRRARCSSLSLLLSTFLIFCRPPQSVAMEEDELKAAFLNYFFQLIRWPEGVEARPVQFCTAGQGHVTSALKSLIAVSEHKSFDADFALIATPKEATQCDYVYIHSDDGDFSLPVIATTRGRAILTVSDIDGFADAGGVIELKRESSQVAVLINMDALATQGLQDSSKLLSVAKLRSTKGGIP